MVKVATDERQPRSSGRWLHGRIMRKILGADIDRDAITAKKTEAQEMRCRAS